MAFVLMLLGGVNAFAEPKTSTLTFTKACDGTGTADDKVLWKVASDAAETNFDNTKGIHYGTGKKAVSYLTLTTSGISGTISKIVVNASGASGTSAKLDVTVNGSTFGTQKQSLTDNAKEYTFEGSASGEIVVKLSQTSTKIALYVKSVSVTYEPAPAKTLKSLNLTTDTAEDIYVGDEFTHEGITITATWNDNTTTDVTNACKYTGYDMSKAGTQTITATYQDKSVKYNVNVKTIANTAETAYTPTKAKELIDAGKGLNVPVYVKGKVSRIASAWSSTNGNLSFYISEDGIEDKFEFYQNYKGADKVKYASVEETPNIGDEVVGYGNLTKYKTIYEFDSGNYIVSIERGKVLKYDKSLCSVILDAADNVFPALTNTYGTSVTYESSDKNVATIDAEGNITLVGVGTTTITATLDADNSVTASYTLNVARAKVWDLSVNQTTTATADKIEWVDNVATMTGDKGKADTNANNYYGGDSNNRTSTRFYANSTFSITPAEGITILKIEYFATSTSDGYTTALTNSTWDNATASSEGKTVTIEPIDGTKEVSAIIKGTTGATKVIVYYTGEPTVENKTLVAMDEEGAYYSTFSSDRDVVFTNVVIVNAVTIEDGKLKLNALDTRDYNTTNSTTAIVTNGYYVPANTGVLIYATDKDITYYTAATGQDHASLPNNQLVAATTNGKFTGDSDHKYYKLAYDDYVNKTGLGFYYGEADGAPFVVKKGLAYLAVPVISGSNLAAGYAFGGNGGDDTTGINGIENDNVNETQTIYNLQGQRVEKAGLRGIYIVNGKKVVLK